MNNRFLLAAVAALFVPAALFARIERVRTTSAPPVASYPSQIH